MKSTGMTRKVDELGRIVLPIEMRRSLGIEEKDSLEIYVEDNTIILRKLQEGCSFCGRAGDVISFRGRSICPDCFAELKQLF